MRRSVLWRPSATGAGILAGSLAAAVIATAGSGVLATFVLEPHKHNAPYDDAQRARLLQALSSWQPVAADGGRVELEPARFEVDQPGCATHGDELAGTKGTFGVSLTVVQCDSAYSAYELANNYAGEVYPARVGKDQYNAIRIVTAQDHAQAAWRLRGTALALGVDCGGDQVCSEELESLVGDIGGAIRKAGLSTADPDPHDNKAAVFLIPLTMWLAVVLPWRAVRRIRRQHWASADDGGRYRDLSHQLRRAARMRSLRRTLQVLGWPLAVAGAFGVVATITDESPPVAQSASLLAIGGGLLFGAHRLRVPGEASVDGVRGTGPRSAVGLFLAAAATATVLWLIVAYALFALLAGYARSYGQDTFLGAIADSPDTPRGIASQVTGYTVLALQEDPSVLYLLVILPVLAVALVVSSIGQRLRAADLATVLRMDERPPILYLRAFAEDALRLPASSLRRTLVQWLLARRTRRFEEVLASTLAQYGPVTAISPPGTRLASLGAAKAHLQHDGWRDAVRDLADRALLVVVSGTPPNVNAGLAWELSVLGTNPDARLLVVQAPWRRDRLRRHWTQFCAVVIQYPLLAPLTYAWVQPGTHVLAYVAGRGWFAWGASTRTDRSYALAVEEAFRLAGATWAAEVPPRTPVQT